MHVRGDFKLEKNYTKSIYLLSAKTNIQQMWVTCIITGIVL